MRSIVRVLALSALSLGLLFGMAPAVNGHQGGESDDGENEHQSSVPEIDPGLLGGAVALLASGMLILRDRRRA